MKIRPKVRYIADGWDVTPVGSQIGLLFRCSKRTMKRIAAALNLAEAVRRGEVKVVKRPQRWVLVAEASQELDQTREEPKP